MDKIVFNLSTQVLMLYIQAYAQGFGVSLDDEYSPVPCPITKNKILEELDLIQDQKFERFFETLNKNEQDWLRYRISITHAEVSTWPADSSIRLEYGSYGEVPAILGLIPNPCVKPLSDLFS